MKLKEKEVAELKKQLKNNEKIIKKYIKNNEKLQAENAKLKQQLKLNKEQKSKAIKLLKDLRNDIKNINKIVQLYTQADYKKITEVQKALRKNNIEEIKELKDTIKTLIKHFENKLKQANDENMLLILENEKLQNNTQKNANNTHMQKAKQTLQSYYDYDFSL